MECDSSMTGAQIIVLVLNRDSDAFRRELIAENLYSNI